MFTQRIIEAFTDDPTVIVLAALWLIDFLIGSFAAGKIGNFRLSFFADTFRNDLLGKLFPYYTLWAAVHLTGIDWSPWGFDVIEEGAGAVVGLALIGSITNTLRDLGIMKSLSNKIAGPDPGSPLP